MSELHPVQRPPTRVPRYVAPRTLDEALSLKAEHESAARAIAGGTDLVVELDRGAHTGLGLLIDLSRIPDLGRITTSVDGIRLGATTTHHDVVADETCRNDTLALAQACLEIGSPQLRNRATVVGNIVTASPANDTISALTALGAVVHVASASRERAQPIGEFITGFRTTTLADDELVTAISLPRPAGEVRSLFVKAGLRRAQAISVVHIAAAVSFDDDGTVTDATVALGSVAATIVTVPGLDELLVGRRLDDEMCRGVAQLAVEAATPIDDLRATADYRSAQVSTMVERALMAIANDEQAVRWPARTPLLRSNGAGTVASLDDSIVDHDTPIEVVVNGSNVRAARSTGVTLLDWLRDEAHCTGVKEGCAEGECGACTVLIDGTAVMGCLVPAARAAGTEVTTVEGLADEGELSSVQRAFVDHHAVQCGFCTPGFLVSCTALLDELPDPSPAEVRAGLAGNLCRCTGYRAIEAAVATAAGAPMAAGGATTVEVRS
jgi:xanthine dehydrogenase iron-sulfur cluster and FAD-binding subunit A